MTEARIQLTDTAISAANKMSEGNSGALFVCAKLLMDGAQIDPDNFMGGLGYLLDFDTLRIYGSKIWMLYKDVCGEDLRVVCAILRAWQLGFVSEVDLRHAIESCGKGVDVQALIAKVEERLPRFQHASVGAEKERAL